MFLSLLAPDQFAAFMFLANEFISSDKTISGEEKSILERMSREAFVLEESNRTFESHSDAASAFDSPKSRSIALLELLGIAYADGDYRGEESKYINGLADEFEIPTMTLAGMQNWVLRQVALTNEALGFLIEPTDEAEG